MNKINTKKITIISLTILLGSIFLYQTIFKNTFSLGEEETNTSYILENVPKNRTQSTNTGLCWAFEFANALEATVLNKYKEEFPQIVSSINNGTRFSPTHLAYATYNKFSDGNNIYGYNTHDLNGGCYGEKFELSYLTSDIGPALIDEDNPLYTIEAYQNDIENDASIPSLTKEEVMGEDILETIKLRTTELIYFDSTEERINNADTRNKIKQYLKDGYAVTLMSHSFKEDCGYNKDTKSLYYTDEFTTCKTYHGAVIIGWNDEYSKTNFTTTPEGNGAFIIRNSLKDDSYYYISYYDTVAYPEYVITGLEEIDYDNKYNYGIINPYEFLGEEIIGSSDKATKQVTLFERDTTTTPEILKEVSFYIQSNDTVSVYFLDGTTDNLDNIFSEENKIGEVTPKLATGYFTLKLTEEINIQSNKFYIGLSSNKNIITLTYNTNPSITPTDLGYKEETNYIYTNNEWHDTYTNICQDDEGTSTPCVNNIQVFTKNTTATSVTLNINDENIILDENNALIKNIKVNTTVETLKEKITASPTYTIYTKDDIEKNDDEILKSGDYISIGNKKYTIYVLGDIRGVGTYTKDDLKEMSKHIIEKNILTNNQIYSADYNNDGVLKMNDILYLLKELPKN